MNKLPEISIHPGNCLEILKQYPDNHFDSIVTDAPYGMGKEPNAEKVLKDWIEKGFSEIKGKGFMGNEWDAFVPQPIVFKEILRVLKPGGHMLCACGTRTQDWMQMSIRFAGFEIRDVIAWHYGTGFPKSLDISKAIDRHFNVDREIVSKGKTKKRMIPGSQQNETGSWIKDDDKSFTPTKTLPKSDQAKEFDGYGTALKPATEFFTLARKPLSEPTIIENVLKWGVGGLNINACRIDLNGDFKSKANGRPSFTGKHNYDPDFANMADDNGRYPANVILDEFMAAELDKQSGVLSSGYMDPNKSEVNNKNKVYGKGIGGIINNCYNDSGGASRFFYVAKASRNERNKGLEGLGFKRDIGHSRFDKCKNCGGYMLQGPDRDSGCTCDNPERENLVVEGNFHPTVKPVSLMRYLVKMITPIGGITCDPFAGSGTTGIAAKLEGMNAVLIDLKPEHCEIAKHRIEAWDPFEPVIKEVKKEAPIPDNQLDLFL